MSPRLREIAGSFVSGFVVLPSCFALAAFIPILGLCVALLTLGVAGYYVLAARRWLALVVAICGTLSSFWVFSVAARFTNLNLDIVLTVVLGVGMPLCIAHSIFLAALLWKRAQTPAGDSKSN